MEESANSKIRQLELSNLSAKEKKKEKNEKNLRELWYIIKHTNMHITGVSDREEKKKGT